MYFADYAPDAHGTPLDHVVVRLAGATDLPACAELLAHRDDGDVAAWAQRLEFWVASGQQIYVAVHEGAVIGYGRLAWLTPAASGGRNVPDGWYLNGVIVDRRYRRRGVGRALTRARCEGAWTEGKRVYFVVNSQNRASMDLHRELGLHELTRDFDLPGVTFSAEGEGVLFGGSADSQGQQVTELRVSAAR